MENKNPLTPHIQIYRWHISSLVSISHRITGIINIIAITLICAWVSLLVLGEVNYNIINLFLNSFVGKFIAIGLLWSFSFQILSEIRHLALDMGYGFELQTTRITGLAVIFGSLVMTILIYFIGRSFI
tara:strand:+ start:1187 stop:1570 length:384 start_codon:yes stop_codon:yes gene_type:complete